MAKLRWKRILRALALLLVGVELLYLVVANLALRTMLVPWAVNQKTLPSGVVSYRSAWSLYPGDLNVRDFLLRVDDHAMRMEIRVERIHARVRLLQLLKKRFHCDWVEGEGARLRVRGQPELAGWSQVESWLPNLPPTVHRYLGGPHTEPARPSELIWVELERVALEDVRELWIDAAHFTGRARVRGRLKVLPTQLLDVGPAYLTIENGQVHTGDEPLLTGVTGRAALWIPPAMLDGAGPGR
jgi:hypothetical protein